jgi:GNAT superfamily N-acetyltransferase
MSSDGIALVPATPDDAVAIGALVNAAYAKWVATLGRRPLPMQVDYQRAVRNHRFDLLKSDGALVGLIETVLRPGHLWIENVAVLPTHQGWGLGRRLLAHAEHLAAIAGCGELRLLTNALFTSNIALYRRLGYFVDRQEPLLGGTTLYMSKWLG